MLASSRRCYMARSTRSRSQCSFDIHSVLPEAVHAARPRPPQGCLMQCLGLPAAGACGAYGTTPLGGCTQMARQSAVVSGSACTVSLVADRGGKVQEVREVRVDPVILSGRPTIARELQT